MSAVALKFVVSAPGKVILFGEHSVVYGRPALAASINKRSTLVFETCDDDAIFVEMSTVKLSVSVPLNVVRQILQKFVSQSGDSLAPDSNSDSFCESIVDAVEGYDLMERNQRISILCLFYLLHRFSRATHQPVNAFKITVSSELSVGAGTGSSASYSVCLAAAFHHYFRVLQNTGNIEFTAEDKQTINDHAFACEQIIHGRASGIDNFVCTYGSIIKMVPQDKEKNPDNIFKALENVNVLRIFLINTGVGRSTAKMIQNVRDLYTRNPTVVDTILNAMGEIAESACSTLIELKKSEQNIFDLAHVSKFKKLEDLVSLNHGLLATLGVSHSSLDTIVNLTKKYDLQSKLTGAGGGGFAFTLIAPHKSNDVILNCQQELEENGFFVDDIIIGGTGVDIKTF